LSQEHQEANAVVVASGGPLSATPTPGNQLSRREAPLPLSHAGEARLGPKSAASGLLHLDHLGTEVGEGLARLRPGRRRRQVEHPNPAQRAAALVPCASMVLHIVPRVVSFRRIEYTHVLKTPADH